MKNAKKALQAIETLTNGDFGLDCETYDGDNKELKEVCNVLNAIYRIAHCEISPCSHPDWEEEKYKILKEE